MSYQVYTNDVIEAGKYKVPNTSIEENCARMGARRVAWAVAHWADEFGIQSSVLQDILEQEAPD